MNEQPAHTITSFDEDLEKLRGLIIRMGRLCEAQIVGAADALARHDAQAALVHRQQESIFLPEVFHWFPQPFCRSLDD